MVGCKFLRDDCSIEREWNDDVDVTSQDIVEETLNGLMCENYMY